MDKRYSGGTPYTIIPCVEPRVPSRAPREGYAQGLASPYGMGPLDSVAVLAMDYNPQSLVLL